MPLGLTISLVTVGVIAMLGILGYLMDKSVDRDERKSDHQSHNLMPARPSIRA
jgi:hypothetical protein